MDPYDRGVAKNLLNSSIQNQANEIESWLNENLSAFQIVKQTIEGVNPDDNEMQGILNQYYGYDADYPEGLYIADENGKLMMAEGVAKSETNPTESVWYRDGLTRVNMGFTDSYVNSDGEAVISASGIINDGSDKLRVISADMTIQRISIIVNSFIEMADAQAFLVNTVDGSILAHRDNQLISTKLSESRDSFLKSVIKLKHAIDNVGRASEEITNITGVIGSIADQTNLLSLNASLEAARLRQENMYMLVLANRWRENIRLNMFWTNSVVKMKLTWRF